MGEEETEQRCSISPGTKREIISHLQKLFHEQNYLVNLFKSALEQMPSDDYQIVIRADKTPYGQHDRRFNAPTINDIAIVMLGLEFERRDIILHRRHAGLQRVNETHRSYDALQYPILFWQRDDGYNFSIKQINPVTGVETQKKVSAMDFYAFRIMIRANQYNHILMCRQLFHQFIVDMYAKIESERLAFIRHNQQKLRAEEYIHLRDAIANDGNPADLGQLVILPSSYTGSPRHMHEYTQDALTYVRKYGCPDLFITFTCNPKWGEITDLLLVGQSPSHRHDILARVFKQKLVRLIDIITKSNIYGESSCWMYTIEWQKRGLPHAHILIWLMEKITSDHIDDIISAELPNPHEDPTLFEVISKHMIHGPCGAFNPNSPCMKDGKCTKNYPRNMIQETQTGHDGYPLYRRRKPNDGGHTAVVKVNETDIEIDNRWVVPYSPLLSKMFNAHINVEYCNSVKSIKYICKYINKGSDMAVFGLIPQSTNDEILNFQMGRYISSNDAIWRILGFNIHERYPNVVHLSVHLENGQRVYYTQQNLMNIINQPPNTTLTAFFQLCQTDAFARTLLYHEIPKYYTWNASTKKFNRRKNGAIVPEYAGVRASEALGRVYTVHPNNMECFCLRLLLHTIRGPKSFLELRTIYGEVCLTYRDACFKLGLLEDDQHWNLSLTEASVSCSPNQMRVLFAIILTTCAPVNPKELWENHKDTLSEDIIRQARRMQPNMEIQYSEAIYNESLILLENYCISINNRTICALGLPAPIRDQASVNDRDIVRETQYDVDSLREFVDDRRNILNDDQKIAYNTVMQSVTAGNGGIAFLDAPGGTGKTFLLNLILANIRQEEEIALAIASTGIASALLDGGRTAHSTLKLPLNLNVAENPTCNISKNSGMATVLKRAQILIWDECTMSHKKAFEALDRSLRDIRDSNKLMGGLFISLSGDFRPTLPVIPRSTQADELNACLKSSYLWKYVKKITLSTNMRVHLGQDTSAQVFTQQLLQLGEGKILMHIVTGNISFPPNFCQLQPSIIDVVKKVFPNILENFKNHGCMNAQS